jgi:hypothetical protein
MGANAMIARRSFLTGLGALMASTTLGRTPPVPILPTLVTNALTRYDEEQVFMGLMDGMIQRYVTTVIYGNPEWSPMRFTGFAPSWSTDR